MFPKFLNSNERAQANIETKDLFGRQSFTREVIYTGVEAFLDQV